MRVVLINPCMACNRIALEPACSLCMRIEITELKAGNYPPGTPIRTMSVRGSSAQAPPGSIVVRVPTSWKTIRSPGMSAA